MTLENYNGAGTHYKRTPFHKKQLSRSAYRRWIRDAYLLSIPTNAYGFIARKAYRIVHLLDGK